LKYKEKDLKYVYYPAIPREKAQISALQHIKKTLFQDSAEGVLTALLKNSEISEKDLDRLEALIKKARKEGK
jgi:predicted transcriptional regulator